MYCNDISQYYCFNWIFIQINSALVSKRDFLQEQFFYTNPKIWKVAYFIESMWTEKLNHNVISSKISHDFMCDVLY